ncbi:MAG: SGNH/GDSL hydrolase family protein [Gemmatimonadetes bacterium]|nr:SGNH/GDSL hydrolase family protein [Gemmatimonadota bacterium]
MTDDPSENQASVGPGRRLAAGVVLLILILVTAEVAVRVEEWFRWRTPIGSPLQVATDLAIRDATGIHPAPNTAFRKWRFNSVGTRGAEPVDGVPRLIVTGASESFGLYESPEREYPKQLADSLHASGCPADVLNAAFPGMSLPTVEQDLRLRLAALHPTAVLYYPTPPQYLDGDGLPQPARPDSTGSGPLRPLRPSSRFAARAANQLKTMLPPLADFLRRREIAALRRELPADSLFTTLPAARLDAFEHDLRRLVGTIRQIGATPLLATHANGFLSTTPMPASVLRAWERFYPRATGATLVAFDSAASARVRQVAADSAVTIVDPWQAFHGLPAPTYFADFSHFTDAGAAKMASEILPGARTALGCR